MLESTDHLSNEVVTQMNAAASAMATTTVTGATLNMAGFDAVRAVVPITDIASGSVVTLKAYRDSASGMGTEEQVAGTATVTSAADDDVNGKMLVLDVKRPSLGSKNYLRFKVTRATANAATGALITEQYLPREVPVSQDATIVNIAKVNEPDAA